MTPRTLITHQALQWIIKRKVNLIFKIKEVDFKDKKVLNKIRITLTTKISQTSKKGKSLGNKTSCKTKNVYKTSKTPSKISKSSFVGNRKRGISNKISFILLGRAKGLRESMVRDLMVDHKVPLT